MRYFLYCRKSQEDDGRQVMSIPSQRSEADKKFGGVAGIDIVEIYEEAKSAKSPGRPIFNEMLSRLERGEAQGIIAWAPDRLARNSVDGGRIVYLIDRGVLVDLKFATYTFENNPQGKFMLSIMFGQSKYYSDALSENVKRGNRTKLENGWLPNFAPLGYLNDRTTKTTVIDPVHFPLIRRIFELMLSRAYSRREIALIARDEWGLRTPKRRKIGGVPLAMSSIYKILTNPFYAGVIVWDGQTYPGAHERVLTIDEFERVQSLLKRPSPRRPRRHAFAYTGMLRCGGCGYRITAQHTVNRFGSRYIYYHCVKRRLGPRCREPAVEAKALDEQIEAFLRSITVAPAIAGWLVAVLDSHAGALKIEAHARRQSLALGLQATKTQLVELTGLRVRGLLTDAEFATQRATLQREDLRLGQLVGAGDGDDDLIKPYREVISFSKHAVARFARADDVSKRLILEIAASNPTLKGKKLSICAAKPFVVLQELSTSPSLLASVDDVQTLADETLCASVVGQLAKALNDEPRRDEIVEKIRVLTDQFAVHEAA